MSVSSYQAGLRSAVRGFYSGTLTQGQFVDALESAIRRGLTQAFIEGAKECGIKQDELTDKELDELTKAIESEYGYIDDFASGVEESEKLAALYNRLSMWVNRYSQVKQQASALACGDIKKVWSLGASEHCSSCVRLSGRVKRNSYWQQKGILPRVAGASYLKCRGYRCQCTLVTTDSPISRGNLPNLP